jgi:catechol 2,3-dioxygenase-like lactoylglutathione lyase family enzyme
MHMDLVSLLVHDYDRKIEFFVRVLGFELVHGSPDKTGAGEPKRWVVVRLPKPA